MSTTLKGPLPIPKVFGRWSNDGGESPDPGEGDQTTAE